MGRTFMLRRLIALVAFAAWLASPGAARAEANVVRVAKQFGVAYMQYMVMQDLKLIEKHAKAAGLDITTEWATFRSSDVMNDALISGSVDFVSLGIPGIITIWSKTKGTPSEVKGVSGLNVSPLMLMVRDPAVKSIKDFKDHHRIALPAVKVAMQAIMLQMAAAKEWGDAKYNALDHLTVSMSHPDATAAMLGGQSEVTANFSSAPFQYRQMKNPNIRRILTSTELFDGAALVQRDRRDLEIPQREPEALCGVHGGAEGGDRLHQRRQAQGRGDLSEGVGRQVDGRRYPRGAVRPGDHVQHEARRHRAVREFHGEGRHAEKSAGRLA
jgi:ABC-type nitrate/sulfonate/bicarbonate transport system substrate-binding protein